MANLLESSQSTATVAPDFYNNYLSGLATSGTKAATDAKYIDTQPLQTEAFTDVGKVSKLYEPTSTAAGTALTSAANANAPLSAATPYYQTASADPSQLASKYMSPYITNVVNSLGEAGQRNIMQNLAPSATAGAVGSGQFGSTRGAQVLGQTLSNANRDILNAQSQSLNQGYNQALAAAGQQNALQAQMGTSAGSLSSMGTQNLTAAGRAQAELAKQIQDQALADINAKATLGSQQQTIAQNKELFPLSNLTTASGLLRGYSVPTTTKTTAQMSPLSAAATIGAGAAGLVQPKYSSVTGAIIPGSSLYDQIKKSFGIDTPATTPAGGSTGGTGSTTGTNGLPQGLFPADANNPSPSGYVDYNGNPVNYDGTPYTNTGVDVNPDELSLP
jgi:hypothetical protein